jgi:hypothetical protein
MANQDPQPEIYTTTHTFDASGGTIAAFTSSTVSIFTNQANNEEVRLYAIAVEVQDNTTGAAATTAYDFAVTIGVGPNNVPSNSFDVGWLHNNISNGGQVLAFSSPVLALFQQPLQITVTNNTAIAAPLERSVKVSLIGELAIQKIAARY